MRKVIEVRNLYKLYRVGDEVVRALDGVDFEIYEGEFCAIVGTSGSGKSTLLNMLAGLEKPTKGEVIIAGKHIEKLNEEQLVTFRRDHVGFIFQSFHLMGTLNAVENVALPLSFRGVPRDVRVRKANEMLDLVKLGKHKKHLPNQMSGGQQQRVGVARALVVDPDIIFADEPTGNLDSHTSEEVMELMQRVVREQKKTLVMVTHDRYFLDSVCNRIVEVDKGQTYSYDTNYSGFLELKAAREESERASERKRQSILRKEIEWMQRGARARSTKQKAHIQRYEALRDQKGPQTDGKVELSSVSSRMGRTTIELHDISKAYGDIVCVKDFTYIFLKNDRIGFVGKNGCGKSTLMKIIAGFIEPDSGEVEIGQTIKIGYFGQEVDIDPELRVIDYVKEAAEFVRTADGLVSASAMLERFLFPPEQQYSPVGKLSGGEKRRLYLLRVLMSAPNVLILDEPTNDLDVETLAILEDYLDGYDGIVITVSHDRYFLDRIAKRIFAFEGAGKIVQYEGGYTDYMNKRPQPASGKTVSENASSTGASASGAQGNTASDGTDSKEARKKKSMETWGHEKKLKFTYKEQKEYETIEADIEKLENRLSEIDDEMVKNATNFGKLNELTKEKEDLEGQLMEKMERWEYLEDLAQKIANLT